MMDYFSTDVPKHIENAIENKNYIEAFLVLHMHIESDLINCVIEKTYQEDSINVKDKESIKEKEWMKMDLKSAARTCLFMNIIEDDLYNRIMSFNTVRNNLAHSILKKNFDEYSLLRDIREGNKIWTELSEIIIKFQER